MEIDSTYVDTKFLPQFIKIKLFRKFVAGGRGTQLYLDKPDTFLNYDPEVPTKIITHGYVAGAETSQVTRIRDGYLLSYDVNVITVDWSPFAGENIDSADQYILATSFMQEIVVPFVVRHIEYLYATFKIPSSSVHLIGHSLGAHLMGMVGKKVKVDWITGLDPALPGYEEKQPLNRLTPADATFVEVVHTNRGDYGVDWLCGTVDYFINNGGPAQPHTHPEDKQAKHAYSFIVYSGAIEFHVFEGVKCDSQESAVQGKCTTGSTARIGDRNATGGVYLIKTTYPWAN